MLNKLIYSLFGYYSRTNERLLRGGRAVVCH